MYRLRSLQFNAIMTLLSYNINLIILIETGFPLSWLGAPCGMLFTMRLVDLLKSTFNLFFENRLFLIHSYSIKNTRWRISDVLEIYLSNAWFFSNTASVTCMRDWDEDKFNEEYDIEFKAIKPTDAVFAALFVFYIANEEAVAKAKETTPPEGIDQM